MSEALEIYRGKLDFLLRDEALAVSTESKFSISEQIKEVKAKIAELEADSNRNAPRDVLPPTVQPPPSEADHRLSVSEIIGKHLAGLDAYFRPVSSNQEAVIEPGRQDDTPEFYYPEATGYAILNLLFLFKLTANPKHLERAHRCARWICSEKVLHEQGGVRARLFLQEDWNQPNKCRFSGWCLCVFDTAICLKAISSLYQADPAIQKDVKDRYDDALKKMASFIEQMLEKKEAIFQADAEESQTCGSTSEERWSMRFGPYLLMAAAALVGYADMIKDEDENRCEVLRTKAQETLNILRIEKQYKGNFITTTGLTDLHAHCYAAEGLLAVGRALNLPEVEIEAQTTIAWALHVWEKHGNLPQIVNANGKDVFQSLPRNDAIAQVLMLGTKLWRKNLIEEKYASVLSNIADYLQKTRRSDEQLGLPEKFHAVSYYSYGYLPENKADEVKTLCSWTNFFVVESLVEYVLTCLIKRTKAFVLAGGEGRRAWPLSYRPRPKALVKLLPDDRSPLQETLARLKRVVLADQIYVVTGHAAQTTTLIQAGKEGIKTSNVLIESDERTGSLYALQDSLQNSMPSGISKDTLLVVAMADGYFNSPEGFNQALERAIIAADEKKACWVSVGYQIKSPSDKNFESDARFGHMVYNPQNNPPPSLATYKVELFVEKPVDPLESVKKKAGDLAVAFECGTVVLSHQAFQETLKIATEQHVTPPNLSDLLHSAYHPESKAQKPLLELWVAPLPQGTKFDDLGTFGPNLPKLFKERIRGTNLYLELGNGAIELLLCKHCVVIAEDSKIQVYGLQDHLIVNSEVTHTALIVPLDKACEDIVGLRNRTTDSYKDFLQDGIYNWGKKYPNPVINESSGCTWNISEGLVAITNCNNLEIHRHDKLLKVLNREYPKLETDPDDFSLLIKREKDEPKLVGHLVDVTCLAIGLLNAGRFSSNPDTERYLRIACLYHDFGGTLEKSREIKEKNVRDTLDSLSDLNPRMLDSRIVDALAQPDKSADEDKEIWRYIDDSIPSVVDFIKERTLAMKPPPRINQYPQWKIEKDILLLVIATQENPELFKDLLEGFKDKMKRKGKKGGYKPVTPEDIGVIFCCLKTADNLVAGRWKWKRNHGTYLLRRPKTELESLAATCAYTATFLDRAKLDPTDYVHTMLNELVAQTSEGTGSREVEFAAPESVSLGDSVVASVVKRLQDDAELRFADRLFLYWYFPPKQVYDKNVARNYLDNLLPQNETPETIEQLQQILELDQELKELKRWIETDQRKVDELRLKTIGKWVEDNYDVLEGIHQLETALKPFLRRN